MKQLSAQDCLLESVDSSTNVPPTTLVSASQVGPAPAATPGSQDSVPTKAVLVPQEKPAAGVGYPQQVGMELGAPDSRTKKMQPSTVL